MTGFLLSVCLVCKFVGDFSRINMHFTIIIIIIWHNGCDTRQLSAQGPRSLPPFVCDYVIDVYWRNDPSWRCGVAALKVVAVSDIIIIVARQRRIGRPHTKRSLCTFVRLRVYITPGTAQSATLARSSRPPFKWKPPSNQPSIARSTSFRRTTRPARQPTIVHVTTEPDTIDKRAPCLVRNDDR